MNKTVTELRLSNNNIGDVGAQSIGEALKVNRTLTVLNLANNIIGDSGAQSIAEALKVNKTVTVLRLRSNNIGDSGAQSIGEALKLNGTLTELYLHDSNISKELHQQVKEQCEKSKKSWEPFVKSIELGTQECLQVISEGSFPRVWETNSLLYLAVHHNRVDVLDALLEIEGMALLIWYGSSSAVSEAEQRGNALMMRKMMNAWSEHVINGMAEEIERLKEKNQELEEKVARLDDQLRKEVDEDMVQALERHLK